MIRHPKIPKEHRWYLSSVPNNFFFFTDTRTIFNSIRYRKTNCTHRHPSDGFFCELSVRNAFIRFDFQVIVTANFDDMRNLINACCFRIDRNVVLGTKKRPAMIFEKALRPEVFGKWTKTLGL